MTPKSFDQPTCRQLVGDERARLLEAKGRAAADAGLPAPQRQLGGSYWSGVQNEADYRIELEAYTKRMARIERMKSSEGEKP